MPRFDPAPHPRVRVSDCLCPGTPHEGGDFAVLYPTLTIDGGLAAAQAARRAITSGGDVMAEILSAALPYQIESWTILDAKADDKGKHRPLPIDPVNVREALPYDRGGKELAEAAFDLYYAEALNSPLASKASRKRTGRSSASPPTVLTSATPPS